VEARWGPDEHNSLELGDEQEEEDHAKEMEERKTRLKAQQEVVQQVRQIEEKKTQEKNPQGKSQQKGRRGERREKVTQWRTGTSRREWTRRR